jgi:DNA-directed RNA polymerase subunit RPC12/RpoP
MNTENKTILSDQYDAYQYKQSRTKSTGIKGGVEKLGLSILGFIISVVVVRVSPDGLYGLLGRLGTFASLFAGVFFLGSIIVNSIRPTKMVQCPKCGVEHSIYRNVRKYMCTNCRNLLLLGEDAQAQPQFSICPYCGLQTAVTNDSDSFICSNCGLVRQLAESLVKSKTCSCPNCQQSVPDEVFYCKTCGNVLKSDLPTSVINDLDWKIGKDAEGHFYFSRILLTGLREELSKTRNLEEVLNLQTKLWFTLLSVEEVLQENQLRASVETLVPEIDIVFATLLESKLRLLQAEKPNKKYDTYALDPIATEYYIPVRRRVERILGDSLTSSGGIGKWDDELIDIEKEDKHSRIRSYKKLENEVARFAAWKGEQKS